ncbi:MAG: NAD-dependent epimerase/dehydratase family protein [Alphaproteobacteria bacterium]|nr:NAD-dependent epimerase/dehydratase family protein [Alphaproteobacteria bacterium]MBV8410869.1 NAD-dependent epimerase/dehydratase family protein [Alphaproteobacteria bacterium]
MKVVITGGAGFLGKKLARRLLQQGEMMGPEGRPERLSELLLFDVAQAAGPGLDDPRVSAVAGDIANFATVQSIVQNAATVFHFAAVVSAGAEADFDLGYRVNLNGTRNVLEACRALGSNPRVVFTSSLAAFGGDLPPAVTDDTPLTPQTSYGAQKSIGEFLVRDYTRKGFLRGTSVRLPTICVRTGLPNKAASTWASSVVREPLTGVDVVCPVTPETIMVVLSPRKTVDAFVRLHDLPVDSFGPGRTLLLNGINVTARELEQAVGRHAGNRKVGKVTWQHDPSIQRICDGWPQGIDSKRAGWLGFETDRDLDEIVRNFIADDLDEQMKLTASVSLPPP